MYIYCFIFKVKKKTRKNTGNNKSNTHNNYITIESSLSDYF